MERILSGPEIRDARIRASRSTFPTWKRICTWRRKQKTPSHVGKKQKAKIFERFVAANP